MLAFSKLHLSSGHVFGRGTIKLKLWSCCD